MNIESAASTVEPTVAAATTLDGSEASDSVASGDTSEAATVPATPGPMPFAEEVAAPPPPVGVSSAALA